MSIEGQGHFFTIYVLGFVCFVLYLAQISGECKNVIFQTKNSEFFLIFAQNIDCGYVLEQPHF